MSKFKIGDKVRVIGYLTGTLFSQIGVVKNITGPKDSFRIYKVEINSNTYKFYPNELELVENKDAISKPVVKSNTYWSF